MIESAPVAATIPTTIIAGYLGAGKTTLVNQLLRTANGLRIAVLVNDFGDINIDADLIESRDGDVIALAGGCVCCSFGSDLMAGLQKLTQLPLPPQHLLIEINGVALPSAVASSLRLARDVQLQTIVVLVDAETIVAKIADRFVGDTVLAQLQAAHLLVLNKSDLIAADAIVALTDRLAAINPRAACVSAQRSVVPVELVLGWGNDARSSGDTFHTQADDGDERTVAKRQPLSRYRQSLRRRGTLGSSSSASASSTGSSLASANPFTTVSLRFCTAIDAELLAASLADPRLGVYRAKVLARRPDGTSIAIQVVGSRFEISSSGHRNPEQGRLICIGGRGGLGAAAIEQLLADASRSM